MRKILRGNKLQYGCVREQGLQENEPFAGTERIQTKNEGRKQDEKT